MRLEKYLGLISVAFLVFGLFACDDTVSSTNAGDNGGLDAIPGFHPGKANGSSASTGSSSSVVSSSSVGGSSSSVAESSSAEESSSSVEESSSSVDFSDSKIKVDEGGVAVITDEYLETVSSSVTSDLDDQREKYEGGEDISGFTKSKKREFFVDDFDFSGNKYYCYAESEEWLEITKSKLLETKLPFLWDGVAYDLRSNYRLNFETPCVVIYIQEK